jgi:hypothetical protein
MAPVAEDSHDSFYELRLYLVAPDRLSEMERRISNHLVHLFSKNGIHPAIGWTTLVGPHVPLFIYLTPWRSFAERSKAWAAFYADAEWAKARASTNAGSELVERYEVLFLRALTPWRFGLKGSLHEMVIQDTAIGQAAAVRSALDAVEAPAYQRAGALAFGAFDVLSGRPLPSLVSFASWQDFSARSAGVDKLASDALLNEEHRQQRRALGHPLLGRSEIYLLNPLDLNWS